MVTNDVTLTGLPDIDQNIVWMSDSTQFHRDTIVDGHSHLCRSYVLNCSQMVMQWCYFMLLVKLFIVYRPKYFMILGGADLYPATDLGDLIIHSTLSRLYYT